MIQRNLVSFVRLSALRSAVRGARARGHEHLRRSVRGAVARGPQDHHPLHPGHRHDAPLRPDQEHSG